MEKALHLDRSTRARKVAIVGAGPTRRKAPYDDPSWDIWAFSSKIYRWPRISAWFEIHHITDLREQLVGRKPGRRSFANYWRFMSRLKCPVYMQKVHASIPNSVVFPVEPVVEEFGRCFAGTAAYMIAYAMQLGYTTIGLWGISPKSNSFPYQRRSLSYLLSIARRRGIEVVLPRGARIPIDDEPRPVSVPALYAYEWRSPRAWWRRRVWRRKRLQRLRRLRMRRRSQRRG